MSLLTIHRKQRFRLAIPYVLFINNQPIALMRSPRLGVDMPAGSYRVGVFIVLMLFGHSLKIGGERTLMVTNGVSAHLHVSDRERWWNLLFNLDLFFWLASFFFTLPSPWSVVYHVFSEGFFAIWLIRLWVIRKRYFILSTGED